MNSNPNGEKRHRVYCAGPLFNSAERAEMEQIAAVLSASGFDTFVPHADGFEFSEVLPRLVELGYESAVAAAWLHAAIFALDTFQVCVGCHALVMNLNGRVPDEGAVAEATMAWMLAKPVVLFKDDVRSAVSGRDNPLVAGLARFETVGRQDELGPRLCAEISARKSAVFARADLPPHVVDTCAAGRELYEELCQSGRNASSVAQLVARLFGDVRTPRPTAIVHR